MSTFYVTTPIYYVNGAPHIGHAYTTIVADTFARYYRQSGQEVFFMTGTDEHGLKIQRAAEAEGLTPQELVDLNSAKFRALFDKLEISYDRFIRTTEDDHKAVVTEIVKRMKASGDIYLDKYEGWYSASDEAYYDESEIEDGHAIASGSPVEWVEESSYFFKLSKYQEPLLKWYNENPTCIQPSVRANEVTSFVSGGLRDLSISRTTFSWGIPMPDDPEHVLYVWVDALTNYITGIGAFQDDARFEKFWPCDLHLIGKDILRFHTVYWPAFLMSAGIEPPKEIFAHGWWMSEGRKMSKTLGNFIDAFALAEEYDLDVLRYFLMREVAFGKDGNFAKERLIERNNTELANNLGNLVNRTFRMTLGFLKGEVPEVSTEVAEDLAIRDKAFECAKDLEELMSKRQLHQALERLMAFSSDCNQYIHTQEPWKLNKEGNVERTQQVLYTALEAIRHLAVLSAAFLPRSAAKMMRVFGLEAQEDLSFATLGEWGGLKAGTQLKKPEILFQKFEAKKEKKQEKKKKEKKKKEKSKPAEEGGPIDYNTFMRVQIQVAKILTAERVEGADKLLKLSIDLGEEQPRTVVAGIAKSFAPEDLIGLHVATVTNLKPAKIFGIPSQAMLLAADRPDGSLELTKYPDDIAPGTRIR